MVDEITHYHNLESRWQVTHWKTKWEGVRKADIKWTRIDMMQGGDVSDWEWETVSEASAKTLIKKENLEARPTKINKFEPAKVPKKRGRPKKQ